MHRTASIQVYDVMDVIYVSVTVRDWDFDGSERTTPELHTATTIPGDGEDTPEGWLRDALVGLIEML